MTDPDRTDDEARPAQLLQIVQQFTLKYYPGDAGIIEEKWIIYEKLSPSDCDEAEEDMEESRMLLPGMKIHLSPKRRTTLVFRVVAAVLLDLGQEHSPSARRIRRAARQAARQRGVPDDLAGELISYLTDQLAAS